MLFKLLILSATLAIGCRSDAPEPAHQADSPSGEPLKCTYAPKATAENPQPEIDTFANCAVRDNGEIRVAPEHLAAMDFDADGLSVVLIAGQWYYIRGDGTKLPVVPSDNWADDFSEGLVRTVQNGKIAYADKAFEIVIPPRYDFGWPFEDGVAMVCTGCRRELEPSGEHTALVGGTWGYVDPAGHEVVPVEYSREQAGAELERGRIR